MRWVWVVVALSLFMLGTIVWISFDIDREMNETVIKTGQILDWFVDAEGIVITVNVEGKPYRLYTEAEMLNVSEPVRIVFLSGKPVAVVQDSRAYGIRDWSELKTLEKMPVVVKR
ncbi:MAG: hypothetical protein PWQ22_587 [Archaeoglobaceae archaeon]|nr:hypothetical protein [Archaeoglobaceae archaeon]